MRFLYLSLLLFLGFGAFSQSPEFFKEDLVFSLDSVYFTVNGNYYFKNPSQRSESFTVLYPVPRCNPAESIDTLIVYDPNSPNRKIPLYHRDTLYSFQIHIPAGSIKTLSISYRQKHQYSGVRYILTTTRYWGKPLETAHYDLIVPDYLEVTEFSYPPDNYTVFSVEKIYHWDKVNFMPDKDFQIRFVRTSKN